MKANKGVDQWKGIEQGVGQFNRKYLIPVGAILLVGLMLLVKFCKVWGSRLRKG